ncbi:hypothetical protein BCF58_1789 [Chryseobacterium defluvii]|uniref:Uncharacterized protein n=1 Tax=Chryseobacterium defluvii TaxID=160396 RepID=A0A495SCS7_9FLAO|nr:hypothetical protein BCF58_1789 [Chryseobacterium defluvii]
MAGNNFDFLDIIFNALNVLDSFSSDKIGTAQTKKNKKLKYWAEFFSSIFMLVGFSFFFLAIRDSKDIMHISFLTFLICCLIGLLISFICCFILYKLDRFYFKRVSAMITFCGSLIFCSITLILLIYFKSGIFI